MSLPPLYPVPILSLRWKNNRVQSKTTMREPTTLRLTTVYVPRRKSRFGRKNERRIVFGTKAECYVFNSFRTIIRFGDYVETASLVNSLVKKKKKIAKKKTTSGRKVGSDDLERRKHENRLKTAGPEIITCRRRSRQCTLAITMGVGDMDF